MNLGKQSSGNQTLELIVNAIKSHENKKNQTNQSINHEIYDKMEMGLFFSSRGSYPLINALYSLNDNINFGNISIIPCIYSIENLLEIISDFGRLSNYDSYLESIKLIYNNISRIEQNRLNYLIKKTDDIFFADLDEVCSGANISERIKIKNQLNYKNHNLYLISFISNQKKQLNKAHVRSFRNSYKKSPDEIIATNIILEDKISWSDDENYYKDINLIYPKICSPNTQYIRNNVFKKFGYPTFYYSFFENFGDLLSSYLGKQRNSMYKLIGTSKQNLDNLTDEKILELSLHAYTTIFDDIDTKYLRQKFIEPSSFEIDYDSKKIIGIVNGKDKVIMDLKIKDSSYHNESNKQKKSYFSSYRYPFCLLYNNEYAQEPVDRYKNHHLKEIENAINIEIVKQ
jgi:hypothetical protein